MSKSSKVDSTLISSLAYIEDPPIYLSKQSSNSPVVPIDSLYATRIGPNSLFNPYSKIILSLSISK